VLTHAPLPTVARVWCAVCCDLMPCQESVAALYTMRDNYFVLHPAADGVSKQAAVRAALQVAVARIQPLVGACGGRQRLGAERTPACVSGAGLYLRAGVWPCGWARGIRVCWTCCCFLGGGRRGVACLMQTGRTLALVFRHHAIGFRSPLLNNEAAQRMHT